MNTKNTIEITPGMNLGIQSPEETVMEEKNTETKLMGIIRECLANLFENIDEKAKSKAQQRFMGMVHAVQKGELDPDEVGSSVAKAAKTMKKKDVKDFAETKHKGLPNHVDESCDGKHPYCGEKKDMEDAEKSSPDKPIEFTKKQSKIKISENKLRNLIKEALIDISNENPFPNEDVYTMDDWRRDGTLKVKEGQLISPDVFYELLESTPPTSTGRIFQPGEAYSHRFVGYPENFELLYQTFKNEGNNYYRFIGLQPAVPYKRISESKLIAIIKESVQEELVDVLSKYTRGEATAEEANKAIMNLANSSNMKMNEERESLNFPEYAAKYLEKNGKKLPDEVLRNGNKKWAERHNNTPDGKCCYVHIDKKQ